MDLKLWSVDASDLLNYFSCFKRTAWYVKYEIGRSTCRTAISIASVSLFAVHFSISGECDGWESWCRKNYFNVGFEMRWVTQLGSVLLRKKMTNNTHGNKISYFVLVKIVNNSHLHDLKTIIIIIDGPHPYMVLGDAVSRRIKCTTFSWIRKKFDGIWWLHP